VAHPRPIAYFIHPTAVVILAVPYACLLFCDRREITRRKLFFFVLWCAIVIAVNSIWIIPLFEYAREDRDEIVLPDVGAGVSRVFSSVRGARPLSA